MQKKKKLPFLLHFFLGVTEGFFQGKKLLNYIRDIIFLHLSFQNQDSTVDHQNLAMTAQFITIPRGNARGILSHSLNTKPKASMTETSKQN
jgi:hypothetical protein